MTLDSSFFFFWYVFFLTLSLLFSSAINLTWYLYNPLFTVIWNTRRNKTRYIFFLRKCNFFYIVVLNKANFVYLKYGRIAHATICILFNWLVGFFCFVFFLSFQMLALLPEQSHRHWHGGGNTKKKIFEFSIACIYITKQTHRYLLSVA